MRGRSVVAIVALILVLSPGYAQNQVNKTDSEIKELERELGRALLKNDSATLDRILADDYVGIDAQGGIKKKVDVVALARAAGAVPRGVMIGPEKTSMISPFVFTGTVRLWLDAPPFAISSWKIKPCLRRPSPRVRFQSIRSGSLEPTPR